MSEAKKVLDKLLSGIGNVSFYITPKEQKVLEAACNPPKAKVAAKKGK